jgi:hypothetical protein
VYSTSHGGKASPLLMLRPFLERVTFVTRFMIRTWAGRVRGAAGT